jgi:ParB/RepB/Spo0J family partition protein
VPELAHGNDVLSIGGVPGVFHFCGYLRDSLVVLEKEFNKINAKGGIMPKKEEKKSEQYLDVPLDKIDEPSGRVRLDISTELIEELGENIREQGLFNPILLRAKGKRFEIVAGHRRFMAFKYLKWSSIPAKVSVMDDLTVALARAAENIFREDISPIEEGAIYLDLFDEHHMNYDQISKRMRKPASRIRRRMDLMKMPACLQKAIHSKEISSTVGEELWGFGKESVIEYYLSFAIDNGATREVARGWRRDYEREQRMKNETGAQGDSLQNPNEPTKHYASCDVCLEAVEIGTETIVRACPECAKQVKEALKK